MKNTDSKAIFREQTYIDKDFGDYLFDKYKDLTEVVVRKNTTDKKAYKVEVFKEKINKATFTLFVKAKNLNGISYGRKYGGFILEEVPYVENKPTKTAKEMQEEFLKNKNATKLEDGGYIMADIERKSRAYRSQIKRETNYTPVYHGLIVWDKENRANEIQFVSRKYGIDRNGLRRHINYYCIGDYTKKYKESTIKEWIESGVYRVNSNL